MKITKRLRSVFVAGVPTLLVLACTPTSSSMSTSSSTSAPSSSSPDDVVTASGWNRDQRSATTVAGSRQRRRSASTTTIAKSPPSVSPGTSTTVFQSTPPKVTTPPTTSAKPAPGPSATAPTVGRSYPWHTNIVSTTFWVGEIFDPDLPDGSQVCSTYDSEWAYRWSGVATGSVPASSPGCPGAPTGGCDGIPSPGECATEPRTAANGYFPTRVTPRENPFYLDLPFDDLNDPTGFSTRCAVIPWAADPGYAGHCSDQNFSYMKNRWVRLVGPNGATCYGQIQDAGPSSGNKYHDSNYVFGLSDARPANKVFNNAGVDVSPALNGCLGFSDLDGQNDRVDWQFVDAVDVPAGPWRLLVTTSGVNN